MTRLYVYALTAAPIEPFECGGRTIASVDLDGLFAATASIDALPSVSEETLREQHDAVLAIAARTDAILPARFGSLVDGDELRRIVELRREAIRDALDLVRGREQMTVRLFGPMATSADTPGAPPASGTEYLRRRRAAADAGGLPGVAAVCDAVASGVAAQRVERGTGGTIAAVYHLVDTGGAAAYRARLDKIRSAIEPIEARVSGPWPPFAFVPELLS